VAGDFEPPLDRFQRDALRLRFERQYFTDCSSRRSLIYRQEFRDIIETKPMNAVKIVATLAMVLVPSASVADEPDWEYRVTPYIWTPTLIADLAIGIDPPTQSETDLLDILNFAFLVNGEVRKGDWGLIGEFNYLSLTDDVFSTPGGRFSSDANLDGFMVGAAGAYRFYEDASASADVFAGVRRWWIDAEIEFQNRSNPSVSRHWDDPIVGARGQYRVTDRVTLWFG